MLRYTHLGSRLFTNSHIELSRRKISGHGERVKLALSVSVSLFDREPEWVIDYRRRRLNEMYIELSQKVFPFPMQARTWLFFSPPYEQAWGRLATSSMVLWALNIEEPSFEYWFIEYSIRPRSRLCWHYCIFVLLSLSASRKINLRTPLYYPFSSHYWAESLWVTSCLRLRLCRLNYCKEQSRGSIFLLHWPKHTDTHILIQASDLLLFPLRICLY